MGVIYDKTNPNDMEIYGKALDNIKFIEDNSNDKPFELTSAATTINKAKRPEPIAAKSIKKDDPITGKGFCIRTGVQIPFNIERPFSAEGYKKWNEYGNPDYEEKYCHFTGEPSQGETSKLSPIMRKNWKKAKELYGL